ncbi:hypothetical protein B0A55_11971, partial [Friedmanniomyces simplex]
MDRSCPILATAKNVLANLICTDRDQPSSTSVKSPKTPVTAAGPSTALPRTLSLPYPPAPPSPAPKLRCVIDLEDIAPSEAYALPCSHVFHTECIEHWLEQSDSCPTCRMDIHTLDPFWDDETNDLAYWPGRWSGSFVEGSDAGSDAASAESNNATTSGSSSPTGPVSERRNSDLAPVRLPVQRLAFHYRLIAELELLRIRADRVVASGVESVLNARWGDFVLTEIRTHEALAR